MNSTNNLYGKYFSVDSLNVNKFGETFSELKPTKDLNSLITPDVDTSVERALFAFLLASSICHATKGGLSGTIKGKNVKGWDYLLGVFCCASENNNFEFEPFYLRTMDAKLLNSILYDYASNPVVELDDLDRRTEIIRSVCNDLIDQYEGKVLNLLNLCNHKVGGDTGAYFRLSQFNAFKDPLRKKSTAFLMTVHFSKIWEIVDQCNVEPMIDYHRMRSFLRTGCLKVNHQELANELINRIPVNEEVENEIRNYSSIICKTIVDKFNLSMFEFDLFFWAHSRSCCRNFPLCVSKKLEHESFYSYISKGFEGKCELEDWCPGKTNNLIRSFWEPILETENY